MTFVDIPVVSIGNSRGIRIPKQVLDRCQIDDLVTMTIKGRRIILVPQDRMPRDGWEDAAKSMRSSGDDELLIPDVLDDDTDEEW